jgi:hypothetical protein
MDNSSINLPGIEESIKSLKSGRERRNLRTTPYEDAPAVARLIERLAGMREMSLPELVHNYQPDRGDICRKPVNADTEYSPLPKAHEKLIQELLSTSHLEDPMTRTYFLQEVSRNIRPGIERDMALNRCMGTMDQIPQDANSIRAQVHIIEGVITIAGRDSSTYQRAIGFMENLLENHSLSGDSKFLHAKKGLLSLIKGFPQKETPATISSQLGEGPTGLITDKIAGPRTGSIDFNN